VTISKLLNVLCARRATKGVCNERSRPVKSSWFTETWIRSVSWSGYVRVPASR